MIKQVLPVTALALILAASSAQAQSQQQAAQAANGSLAVAVQDDTKANNGALAVETAVGSFNTAIDNSSDDNSYRYRYDNDQSTFSDSSSHYSLEANDSFLAQPVADGILNGSIHDTIVRVGENGDFRIEDDDANDLLVDQSINVSGQAITNLSGVNSVAVSSGVNVLQQNNVSISAAVSGY